MRVIYILWLREVKKYLRSRVQIIASLGSPIMYLGVLGFGLGPIFQKAGQGSYLQFMAPGVIGMTVLFPSMFPAIPFLCDPPSLLLGDRFRSEGHVGFSIDHGLPGDADLLPFRRSVSAYKSAQGADAADAPGSAHLWCRWSADSVDWRHSLRNRDGCGGVGGCGYRAS